MRLPSYGRAFGALLREQKSTRRIPLVFLEGDPAKTELTRRLLPDAGFARLSQVGAALRRAVRQAPAMPVLPDPTRIPPARKLRITEGSRVALWGAPEGFDLGALPNGAQVRPHSREGDIVLLFVKSVAALGKELPALARSGRPLWVLWPKRASGVACEISLPRIQEVCAPLGLVGYKACAIDGTWSAVAVSRRSGRHKTA